MIDHLLKAPTEAAMITAVGSHINLRNADGWRGDLSFPCQVIDNTDPENPTARPDFYLWVALPSQDDVISALPECIIVADRDAAERGEPFVLWATLPATELDVYTVSPVIAGSRYPFGSAL